MKKKSIVLLFLLYLTAALSSCGPRQPEIYTSDRYLSFFEGVRLMEGDSVPTGEDILISFGKKEDMTAKAVIAPAHPALFAYIRADSDIGDQPSDFYSYLFTDYAQIIIEGSGLSYAYWRPLECLWNCYKPPGTIKVYLECREGLFELLVEKYRQMNKQIEFVLTDDPSDADLIISCSNPHDMEYKIRALFRIPDIYVYSDRELSEKDMKYITDILSQDDR